MLYGVYTLISHEEQCETKMQMRIIGKERGTAYFGNTRLSFDRYE